MSRVPPTAYSQKGIAFGRLCVRPFEDGGGGLIVLIEALDYVLTELFDLFHVILQAKGFALESRRREQFHLVPTDFTFHLGHPVGEAYPADSNDQGEGAWLFLNLPADCTFSQSFR